MAKQLNPDQQRSRKFALTSYLPLSMIEGVLEHRPVRSAVLILHDKDTYTAEDEVKEAEHKAGTPKDPHYHILLATNNAATLGQVKRWFKYVDSDQNTLGQVLNDDERMLRYLTHKDDPEKYQYREEEIKEYGEGKETFLRASLSSGRSTETIENLIDDINANTPRRTMLRRYGRDFILNEDRYRRFAYNMATEEKPNSTQQRTEEWQKICDLFSSGVFNEYDLARYAQHFGVPINEAFDQVTFPLRA